MSAPAHPAALRDRAIRRAASLTRSGRVGQVFDQARALAGVRALGFDVPGSIELVEYGVLDQRGVRTMLLRLQERCPCRGASAPHDVAMVTVTLTVRPGCSRARQRDAATDTFIDVFRRHLADDLESLRLAA